MNAGVAKTPARMSQQIYAASQKGDPTAFLMWHATPGKAKDCDPGRVTASEPVEAHFRYAALELREQQVARF